MLFSGKIRFHDVARLTARSTFATICHYSPLFAAIHHYSRLFVLFATIRCSLFATIRYSLFGFSRHPQSARCLRTKRTHLSRIASSRGNMCIDTPSVLELFVQLTFPGPPATQYLPEILFFGFSTFTPHSMLTRGLL